MSRTGRLCLAGSLLVLGAVTAGPAGAGQPEYESAKGGQVIILDEPCPLNQFPPIEIAFASPSFDNPGANTSVQCTTTVSRDGRVLNGAGQVRLGGEIFDVDGNLIRILGTSGRNLNPFGRHAWGYAGDPSGGFVGIQIQGGFTGNTLADQARTDCRSQSRTPCVRDLDTACLFGNGRFQVEVDWRDFSGATGPGQVVRQTNTGADFFFFNPNNTELLIKILNSCRDNDHFWVFYSSLTDVEFELTVTDTQAGVVRSYTNPLGQPANAVTDTSAFATCP